METNRKATSVPAPKKRDVFQGFEWISSEYNLVDILKTQERQEFVRKRMEISQKDFVQTGSKSKTKLRHEDLFGLKVTREG